MKGIEVITVSRGLQMLNGVSGVKLGSHRAKLSRIIIQEIKDMEAFYESDDWKSCQKLIDELNLKFCKKEKGSPVLEQGNYVFNDMGLRNLAYKEMEEVTHKDLFERRTKMMEEYKEVLKGERSIVFEKIPISLFPEDTKTEVIDLLWPVIDDTK